MKPQSLKSRVNNQKGCLIRGKIAKSSVTFRKNKPNSPNVQTYVTSFTTTIYTIYASLTKVKNKPNQTQFKPNSNPNFYLAIFNLSSLMTSEYVKSDALAGDKTNPNKPNQTQFRTCTRETCPRLRSQSGYL